MGISEGCDIQRGKLGRANRKGNKNLDMYVLYVNEIEVTYTREQTKAWEDFYRKRECKEGKEEGNRKRRRKVRME